MSAMDRSALIRATAIICVVLLQTACVMNPRLRKMQTGAIVDLPAIHSLGNVSVSYDTSIRIHPDQRGAGGTVTPERFVEAVSASVVDTGLFDAVVAAEQADYHLTTTLLNVQLVLFDPVMGYSLGFDVVADWKLQKHEDESPVFHEVISERGRANFGDALNGITRGTIARERGAAKNITTAIKRLSEASQDPGAGSP